MINGYNSSKDPMQANAMGIPQIDQPHTTAHGSTEAPAQFTGWGHAARDPRDISDYRGSDLAGAPAPISATPPDPRDARGETGSVYDTGLSRVSYNNQAPAPKTF